MISRLIIGHLFFVDILLLCVQFLVQRYGGCGFFMWYDAPMCDKSKQIILGLLNGLKKKENEIIVYWKIVKCMFWLMIIPWTICLALLISCYKEMVQVLMGKICTQCYLEICKSNEGSIPTWFSFVFFVNNLNRWEVVVEALMELSYEIHVLQLMEWQYLNYHSTELALQKPQLGCLMCNRFGCCTNIFIVSHFSSFPLTVCMLLKWNRG